jgi:hypothetical protein
MPRVDITGNFERHRILDPSDCVPNTFRTAEIGRIGFSKRVACINRHTGKWATQSLLIHKDENPEMKRKLRKNASAMISRMKRLR